MRDSDQPSLPSSTCSLATSVALRLVSAPSWIACSRNGAICAAELSDTAPNMAMSRSKSPMVCSDFAPMAMVAMMAANPAI